MAGILETHSWRSEILTRALVARSDCDILAELIVLRDQANESERIDQHFEKVRDESKQMASTERERSFANAHEKSLENMNSMIWMPRTWKFLDIGCAPGGFSQYLLRKNRRARGVGITLPEDLGGRPFAMSNPEYLSRYKLHVADITAFNLAPKTPKPAPPSPTHNLTRLPFALASYDLVICDAQWVLNPDNLKRAWNWTRLIVSQLLIALRAVSPGGSIFMRLACVERTLTGRILLALCRTSELVRTVKSDQFQGIRSYFYVLAQRIDPLSREFQKLVAALERLWYIMTFGGKEGYGRDIDDEDELLITSDEELLSEHGLSVLVQLGTPPPSTRRSTWRHSYRISSLPDNRVVLETRSWRSEILTRALVARNDCDILAELIVLRDQASESERVDQFYQKAQDCSKQLTPTDRDRAFLATRDKSLENMNRMIWMPRTWKFLDIGCAPGGFTHYFLRKNRRARGSGITLPEDLGGRPFAVTNPEYLNRYTLHVTDLTAFDLAPKIPKPTSPSPSHNLTKLPFEPASHDLVICDAQWVLNPDNLKRPWNWTRLVISQLLIALRAVSPGGSIFMRLSCVERTITGRILLALCRTSELVRTVKSNQFQAIRSYFYVLAQRIDPLSQEFQKLVAALERLWYIMTFEGEEGYGRDIDDEDELSITSDEDLLSEHGLSVLVQLGTPVWDVQYGALCSFLAWREREQ